MSNALIPVSDIKRAAKHLRKLVELGEANDGTFEMLDNTILYSYSTREKCGILLSMALSCMRDLWDSWPLTSTALFEYKFYNYAASRTTYAPTTIDNMVRAGRTWLQGLPESVPDRVQLYDRNGEPTGEEIVPDPYSLSVSKLLVTSAAARDGRLWENKVALGQLFNPEVGVHVVSGTIQRPKIPKEEEKQNPAPSIIIGQPNGEPVRLFLDGPFIMVHRNGQEPTWVAELNTEGFVNDPMVKRAVKYLVAALQIRE